MSPAVKNPPKDAPAPDADPLAGLSNDNANAAVADMLDVAQALADEKATVYGKIDANRQILRQYKTLGQLSEAQAKAIDLFYPPVKAKAKADGAKA